MDRMKKLLMMDSRTFNRLTTPKDRVLNSMEGEMSDILNDDSTPEDVRAKRYASAQTRYLKLEHPQWGETVVTKPVNQQNVIMNAIPNNITPNQMGVNARNEIPIYGEDISGLDETALYGRLMTPIDIEKASNMQSGKQDTRAPSIYVTPGHPNTRSRKKKVKFESKF